MATPSSTLPRQSPFSSPAHVPGGSLPGPHSGGLHNGSPVRQVPGTAHIPPPLQPGVGNPPHPRHVQPNNSQVAGELVRELENQLSTVLGQQWASSQFDLFLLCLDDVERARKEGVEISISTPQMAGQSVKIAPPDVGISPADLAQYKTIVRAVLKKQKHASAAINYDEQVQGIGQNLTQIAKQAGVNNYNFKSTLAGAKAKAHSFQWQDPDSKMQITITQTNTQKRHVAFQDEEQERKKLEQQKLAHEVETQQRLAQRRQPPIYSTDV